MKTNRQLGLGGILAPAFYYLALIIASFMRPGYSHVSQFVSELGEIGAPSAPVTNYLGFVPIGVCLLAFTYALFSSVDRGWLSIVGGILLALYGVSFILAGFFSCEPGCESADPILSETIHNMSGISGMAGMIIALFLWSFVFRRSPSFEGIWIYTLISSIVSLVLFLVFGMSLESGYVGLWQRLLDLVTYAWFVVVGWRLWSGAAVDMRAEAVQGA